MKTTAEAISSTPPSQSTLRRGGIPGSCPSSAAACASDASPSGTLIQKIIDQCRCSANTPPRIGPADTGGNPDAAEIGLILAALARRHDVGNHRLHDRHDAAAAKPLQAARQDQHRHVRRQRAQHRARDEQAERRDDHGAAAVDVAERAEYRRHRGRGQQIGRDHPRQVGDIAELPADGRQRGRHDGLVERGQKHRQHQAHQDGADFARRQRRLGLRSAARR